MPNEPERNWNILFKAGVIVFLILTLVLPQTREIHWQNVRALLGLQFGTTTVNGRERVCEDVAKQWTYDSGSSVDAYLLLETFPSLDRQIPDEASWQGHPLAQWGAVAAAVDADRAANGYREPRIISDRALPVIHIAQRAHPENGALWLAEALVHFAEGKNDSAISALQIASNKTKWNAQSQQAYLQSISLLQSEGVNKFDAAQESERVKRMPYRLAHITDYILDLLTESVMHGDDAQFTSLLELLAKLHNCTWVDSDSFYPVIKTVYSLDLFEAMECRMNREPLDEEALPWPAIRKARRKLVFDYVRFHAGEDMAFETFELDRSYQEKLHSFRIRCTRYNIWLEVSCFSACFLGMLTATLLALSVCLFCIELPFTFASRRDFVGTRILSTSRFWASAVAVLAASSLLLYRSFDVLLSPTGPLNRHDSTTLRDVRLITIAFFAITVLMFTSRIFCKHRDLKEIAIVRFAALLIYILFVCAAAQYRHDLIA